MGFSVQGLLVSNPKGLRFTPKRLRLTPGLMFRVEVWGSGFRVYRAGLRGYLRISFERLSTAIE